MDRIRITVGLISVQAFVLLLLSQNAIAQNFKFDCPAMLAADIVESGPATKTIQVVVPVSIVARNSSINLDSVDYEVFWNRNAHAVADYAPKTAMQTDIDGPIEIERKRETSYRVGVDVSSGYFDAISPSLDAGVSRNHSERRKFNEIPEHEVLLSSGIIKRGTGVSFRFRPSRTTTLEGGRELIVAFDVPASWRAGVLQVTGTATATKKVLGLFGDEIEFQRTFVMPIFLQDDVEAQQSASQFARAEQLLRMHWRLHQKSTTSGSRMGQLFQPGSTGVSELWVHQLIQHGSGTITPSVQRQLPRKVASAAKQFNQARSNLLTLSR